jgi:hypothetical protein
MSIYEERNLTGDGFYGEYYYSKDINPDAPFNKTSFGNEDVFPKVYVEAMIKTYSPVVSDFPSGLKVLDVGCCRGAYTREFLKHQASAFGIDFSQYAYDNRVCPAENFIFADMLSDQPYNAPISPALYDFIIANDILEHFTNDDALLVCSKMFSVLHAGGFAHINIGMPKIHEHLCEFSISDWRDILSQYGIIRDDLKSEFLRYADIPPLCPSAWDCFYIVERL